jgi:hypothetical protein
MIRKLKILCLLAAFLITGCMNDDALWERLTPPLSGHSKGIIILNQGTFNFNNASLSYYNPTTNEIFNDIFFHVNGLLLGDVAQSMHLRDTLAYVVLNNSGRIYIINTNTFRLAGKITGFISPRYIHFVNDNKAYVTDLYARAITIVDPVAMTIIGSIAVSNPASSFYQHSTEQMVQVGKYLFVSCWSFDNKILVIDTETDTWVDTIDVFIQPGPMQKDKDDNIWILTDGGFEGNPFGHEPPALFRLNPFSRQIEKVIRFNRDDYPRDMAMNETRDTLYIVNRHIYRYAPATEAAPQLFIRSPYTDVYSGGYFSISVDPVSSEIYVGDAFDMTRHGNVLRFAPDGTLRHEFKTGIIPAGFGFKSEK